MFEIYVSPVPFKYENSVTKMTPKNSVDEQFIEDWQTTANIIQKYIKQLVIHEVDVITSSDWFDEKLIDAIQDSKKLTPKK